MHSQIVFTPKHIDIAYNEFVKEFNNFKHDRSSITVKKEEGNIIFLINSKDIVAMRSSLNSITKLIEVYLKIEDGTGKIDSGASTNRK